MRNTRPGGRFHCWVYAHEGNGRRDRAGRSDPQGRRTLPWWVTKYGIATPLVVAVLPLREDARRASATGNGLARLPLHDYSLWIAQREFAFFRHVAFDQLVTPQTAYIDRARRSRRGCATPDIAPGSAYVTMRNGNSWKFGRHAPERSMRTALLVVAMMSCTVVANLLLKMGATAGRTAALRGGR